MNQNKNSPTPLLPSLLGFSLPFYALCSLIAMAVMNIGFLFVFLAFLAGIFIWHKRFTFVTSHSASGNFRLELSRYGIWAAALFVTCLLSLVVAKIYPFNYGDHDPEITAHGFLKIWYLFCPFILVSVFAFAVDANLDKGAKLFLLTVRTWWAGTCALSIVAVIQFYTGWPLRQVIPTNPNHFHAILFLGHHLSVASVFIFPTFTALALVLGAYTRGHRILRFEAIAGLCGILILFLSYARTAWLAIPIGIVLIFARYLHRKQLVASLVTMLVTLGALSQTTLLKERIENNMGIQDRFRLWHANIDFFLHRPITGIGWLKTQEMSEFYFKSIDPTHYRDYFWGHAHNNFFEMLGGTGILGLAAFIGWTIFTLGLAIRTAKQCELRSHLDHIAWLRLSDFSWGIFVALLLLHFNGLTNVTFWEGKVMHQQMFAVGLLLMIQYLLKIKKPD
jgi:O-antigen ligase